MTRPRIGSLCSGYGGLDLAAAQVLGGHAIWHADNDQAAARVLEHHWPGTPNHGDITATVWSAVEPVDVVTAGYPCQPDSAAGKRRGAQDERWIWPVVRDAIRDLGPHLVVLENVRGHLGRGFPTVVGDLADIGYDTRWCCLPASAVGAPHRRERLFAVAQPVADTDRLGQPGWGTGPARPAHVRRPRSWPEAAGCSGSAAHTTSDGLLRDARGAGSGEACGSGERLAAGGDRRAPHANAHGGRWAPGAATAGPGRQNRRGPAHGDGGGSAADTTAAIRWGRWASAIERWEAATRRAPDPVERGRRGNLRLNPAFSEWMMGLPASWVTGVPGLSRADQLRLIGNGVVPQQAVAALQWLLNLDARAGAA